MLGDTNVNPYREFVKKLHASGIQVVYSTHLLSP